MSLKKAIQQERETIVDGVLIAYATIIALPVTASLFRVTEIGWQPVMATHIATCIFCWIAVLLRKRISYTPKATFIIGTFMITGILGIYQFGLIGNGMTFSILAPVLAALFFNLRVALTLLGLVAAGISLIACYVIQTHHLPGFNLTAYVTSYTSWFDFLFAFVFVAGILTVTGSVLLKRLTRILTQVSLLKEQAEKEVKILSGLLPICAHCKKIRDDKGYWNQLENYIVKHSEVQFSHSICEDCAKEFYPDLDLYDDQ